MGRSLRTVQRWHAECALPVHHFAGSKGSVFAFPDELDRWLTRQPEAGPGFEPGQGAAAEREKKRSSELTAKADAMWELRSEKNLPLIASLYREAIGEDPGNRAALIGYSKSLISGALFGDIDGRFAFPGALEALRRLPEPDRGSPEAKCVSSWLKMVFERRWDESRSGFEEVLEATPAESFAIAGRALLHVAEGNISEASRLAWKARRLSPFAMPLNFLHCWICYLSGEYDDALELVCQAAASGARGSMLATVEALILTQTGQEESRTARIEAIAAEFESNWELQGILGYNHALTGRAERARQTVESLRRLSERKRRRSSYALALVLLALEEKDEAASCLEQAIEEGALWSLGFRYDHLLQPLRSHHWCESLLR